MERRSFVRSALGVATLPLLPEARDSLEALAADLGREQDDTTFWRRVRSEFLLNPGYIHLNCGSIGCTPRVVLDAVTSFFWETEGQPQAHVFGGDILQRMEDVREKAAEFLGAGLGETALTRNTTEGMNAVAMSLSLEPGDQILTTNHEHPGGMVCWEHLAERDGAEIVKIEMPAPVQDSSQILELVERRISPKTKVCSFSHVCTITGLVMPLAEISRITQQRGILLVADGAQAPGMLNVNVKALGVDTYASSSHKWMLSPKGCGLLYISEAAQDRVKPLMLRSGYGAYTGSYGTRNVPLILGHGVAMDFHNTIGRTRVEDRCRTLQGRLRDGLSEVPSIRMLTPDDATLVGGILSVSLERGSRSEVRTRMLDDHQIILKTGSADYNAIRFSTHIFNSENDIDRAVEHFGELVAAAR
jgi:selenocysteine lyase/cysteine desulfurase